MRRALPVLLAALLAGCNSSGSAPPPPPVQGGQSIPHPVADASPNTLADPNGNAHAHFGGAIRRRRII
jgi:hypothetical protein